MALEERRERGSPFSQAGTRMSKADDFREEAAMCERMARTLSRDEARTEYRRMATQWRQLADRVDTPEDGEAGSPDTPRS